MIYFKYIVQLTNYFHNLFNYEIYLLLNSLKRSEEASVHIQHSRLREAVLSMESILKFEKYNTALYFHLHQYLLANKYTMCIKGALRVFMVSVYERRLLPYLSYLEIRYRQNQLHKILHDIP